MFIICHVGSTAKSSKTSLWCLSFCPSAGPVGHILREIHQWAAPTLPVYVSALLYEGRYTCWYRTRLVERTDILHCNCAFYVKTRYRRGGDETICPPTTAVRQRQKSRRIYVRSRTGLQSAHLWWPAVAILQAANVPIA